MEQLHSTKCGYVLLRRKRVPKKWKKKFIVLDEQQCALQIFKNDQEYSPSKILYCENSNSLPVTQILSKKNHPFAFQVFGDLITTKNLKKSSTSSKKFLKLKIDANNAVEREEWMERINTCFEKKRSKKQFLTLVNILQEKLQQFSTEISETLSLRLSILLDRTIIQCEEQQVLEVLLDGKFFKQLGHILKKIYESSPTSIKISQILIKCDHEEKSTIDENGTLSLVFHPKQDLFEVISQHSLQQLLEQEKFLMIQNIVKDWKEYQEMIQRMKNLLTNPLFSILLESDDSLLDEAKNTNELFLQKKIIETLEWIEKLLTNCFRDESFKEVFISILENMSITISVSEELIIRMNSTSDDLPCIFIGKMSTLTEEFLYSSTYTCYFAKLKQEIAAKLSNCEMEWEKSFGARISISILFGKIMEQFPEKIVLFASLLFIKHQIFNQIANLIGIFKDFEYDLAHYFNSIVIVAERADTAASLPSFLSRKVLLIRVLVKNEKDMKFEDVNYKSQIVSHISKSSPTSLVINLLEAEEEMLESVDGKLNGKKRQQESASSEEGLLPALELISSEAKYNLVNNLETIIPNSSSEDILDAIQKEIQIIQSLIDHNQRNQIQNNWIRFMEEYITLVVEESSEVTKLSEELRVKFETQKTESSNEEILISVLRYILPKRIQQNRKNRRNIVLLGEAKTGKTTLLCKLKNSEIRTNPSIGFASEVVEYKSSHLVFHDMGGNATQLSNWKFYLTKCKRVSRVDAIVYVLDLSIKDEKQIEEIRTSLKKHVKFFCKLNESLTVESLQESTSPTTTPNTSLLSPSTPHHSRRNSLRSPIASRKSKRLDFVDYRLPNLIIFGTKQDLPEALTSSQIQTLYIDWIQIHIINKQKYCRAFYFQKANLISTDESFVEELLQFLSQ